MTLDYFYGQAGELFSFFRIPKALFQEQRFQNLSTDAKTLYGILLDRMSLSVKNEWFDKKGRVFIIFTIEDVKRTLCCADNKAMKLFRELEKFGLVERKRRGLGKPSLVYVKNFSSDLSNERVQNRENHESGAFKKECQDPPKSRCNKNGQRFYFAHHRRCVPFPEVSGKPQRHAHGRQSQAALHLYGLRRAYA